MSRINDLLASADAVPTQTDPEFNNYNIVERRLIVKSGGSKQKLQQLYRRVKNRGRFFSGARHAILVDLVGAAFPTTLSQTVQFALDGSSSPYEASGFGASKVLRSLEAYDSYRAPRSTRTWNFDGTDDLAEAAGRVTTGNPTNLTACGWIKTTDASTGTIIAESLVTGNERGWSLIKLGNTIGSITSSDGTIGNAKFYQATTTTVNDGDWHFVAYTFAPDDLKLYVDGNEETLSKLLDPTVNSIHDTAAPLTMDDENVGGTEWPGEFRDFRVYNVTKTLAELDAIQADDLSGSSDTTGLLAWYPCNEERDLVGYDMSGNGNHMDLKNITQSTFHGADTAEKTYNPANRLGHTGAWSLDAANSGEIVIGDATAVTVTETSMRVRCNADNQMLWSYQNTVATGVFVSAGVLTGGASVTIVAVTLDGSSSTPALAGAALNDGEFHDVGFTVIGAPAASDVRIGTDGTTYGDITVQEFSFNSGAEVWDFRNAVIQRVLSDTNSIPAKPTADVYSHIIPREIGTTNDVTGEPLKYLGQCPYPMVVNVPHITLASASSMYIEDPSTTADFDAYPITMSAWVNTDLAATQTIACVCDRTDTDKYLSLETTALNEIQFSRNNSTTSDVVTATTTIEANTWTHVVWVIKSATAWDLYIDGCLAEEFTGETSVTMVDMDSTTLGGRRGVSIDQFFNGGLSEIGFWKAELDQDDIFDLYEGTIPGTPYRWFPLQEGDERDIFDAAGGGDASSLVNGVVATAWASKTFTAKDHYATYGGEIFAGVPVPGKLDLSGSARLGNANNVDPGFLSPMTEINRNLLGAAELNELGMTLFYAPAVDIQTTAPADTKFEQKPADDTRSKLFTTDPALTGQDLSDAEDYIA